MTTRQMGGRNVRRAHLLTAAATAALLAASALPVQAEGPAVRAEEPTDRGFVIVKPTDPGVVKTQTGTFYPTGPIDKDTLVVVADADGSLPGGLSEETLEKFVAARDAGQASEIRALGFTLQADGSAVPSIEVAPQATYSYVAAYNIWSSPYKGTYLIGANDQAQAHYWFSVTLGSNQQAAGQGLSYYRGYNGSEFGVWSQWRGLGIASDHSNGGASLPWGNVAATKQFRAMSTVLHLATGNWGS